MLVAFPHSSSWLVSFGHILLSLDVHEFAVLSRNWYSPQKGTTEMYTTHLFKSEAASLFEAILSTEEGTMAEVEVKGAFVFRVLVLVGRSHHQAILEASPMLLYLGDEWCYSTGILIAVELLSEHREL